MKKSMLIRILTSAVLIAIVVPIVYLGGAFLNGLLVVVACLGAYEIANLSQDTQDWILTCIYAIAIICLVFIPHDYFLVGLVSLLVALFVYYLFVAKTYTLDHLVYSFLMILLVTLAMRNILTLYRNGYGFVGLLYVAFATFLCDAGAYFIGSRYGKRKLIPDISPNKTIEGALGGYACGAIGSFLFGVIACKQLPIGLLILSSLLLPAVAQVGDISFSAIKRRYGIKDFGSLLPGHGGIFDRIDSLIFTLMVFHALLILWGI